MVTNFKLNEVDRLHFGLGPCLCELQKKLSLNVLYGQSSFQSAAIIDL